MINMENISEFLTPILISSLIGIIVWISKRLIAKLDGIDEKVTGMNTEMVRMATAQEKMDEELDDVKEVLKEHNQRLHALEIRSQSEK
jgi:uncharacterized coiled-coil DUF342 family protein